MNQIIKKEKKSFLFSEKQEGKEKRKKQSKKNPLVQKVKSEGSQVN